MHKKKRKMLPFVPTEDRAQRMKQMASAATALRSSKMEFSNELTYVPSMAPKSSNQAKLEEGGMQVRILLTTVLEFWLSWCLTIHSLTSKVLTKEDKETIEFCRRLQKRGEYPPLLVVFDSHEGYFIGFIILLTCLHFSV
jgi:hypothetical protein